MSPEQLQQMVSWLNLEIVRLNESINDAHQTNNYGRETQYEGMREAFKKFLDEFIIKKEDKLKAIIKPSRSKI